MEKSPLTVPRSVWVIGVVSLLITSSAAMLFSVFALFLDSIGVAASKIALIDGFVEGVGNVVKVFSGVVSDLLRRRTVVFALGALCTALSRAAILCFMSFPGAVAARLLDRLGNGLQATPRDALIGAHAPAGRKGTCFGVRQAMGTLGSVIGIVVVGRLLRHSEHNFRLVFWAAGVPAFMAFLLIITFIRDPAPRGQAAKKAAKAPFEWRHLFGLGARYWVLMAVVGVFMLSRFSESLLILRGKHAFCLTDEMAIRSMLVYNVACAVSAFVSGFFTDRCRAANLLILGCGVMVGADVLIIMAGSFPVFLLGALFWGVQIGLMQNVFCAGVTALVPEAIRGTGFSVFYFISSISILLANIFGGLLMRQDEVLAFVYSAGVSLIAGLVILVLARRRWI